MQHGLGLEDVNDQNTSYGEMVHRPALVNGLEQQCSGLTGLMCFCSMVHHHHRIDKGDPICH